LQKIQSEKWNTFKVTRIVGVRINSFEHMRLLLATDSRHDFVSSSMGYTLRALGN